MLYIELLFGKKRSHSAPARQTSGDKSSSIFVAPKSCNNSHSPSTKPVYPSSPEVHNIFQLPTHPHNILNVRPNTATLPPRGPGSGSVVDPFEPSLRPRTAPHTYTIDTARDGLLGNSQIGGVPLGSDEVLGQKLARERLMDGRNRSEGVISP